MTFVKKNGWKIWAVLMVLIILTGLRIPLYIIPPDYLVDHKNASYNRETEILTLIRETRMSRRFPFIDTYAEAIFEAEFLGGGGYTCETRTIYVRYEVAPNDTVTLKSDYLPECVGDDRTTDIAYRLSLRPAAVINSGIFEGLTFVWPRVNVFQTIFTAPLN